MKANCTDCKRALPRIDYIRPLQPDQDADDMSIQRDPLCKPCWDKALAKLARTPDVADDLAEAGAARRKMGERIRDGEEGS